MRIAMGRWIAVAAVATLCAQPLAVSAEAAKQKEPGNGQHEQQNRMKRCNAEAAKKNLKGDERKAFMSACLKG